MADVMRCTDGLGSPLQMALSSLALLARNRHEESMGTAFRERTSSKTYALEKDLEKLLMLNTLILNFST